MTVLSTRTQNRHNQTTTPGPVGSNTTIPSFISPHTLKEKGYWALLPTDAPFSRANQVWSVKMNYFCVRRPRELTTHKRLYGWARGTVATRNFIYKSREQFLVFSRFVPSQSYVTSFFCFRCQSNTPWATF